MTDNRLTLRSYADTRVPSSRSREQIEAILKRVGVDAFRWTTTSDGEGVEFIWPHDGQRLGFRLVIHTEDDRERARMLRVLFWYLKTKIEAIEAGLVDMEQEFLPHMLMPDGHTVYEMTQQAGGFERLAGPSMIALPGGQEK